MSNSTDHRPIWRVREKGWQEIEWRSLYLVNHSLGEADDERLGSLIPNLERFCDSRDRVALAVLTGLRVRPPSTAGRKRLVEFMKTRQRVVQETAVWIPAEGLFGAAMRSVATGIFVIGAPWLNSKVIAKRVDFVSWVAKVTETALEEAESVVACVEDESSSSTA